MLKGKLFTDGGARGNPGPAAIGGVLTIEGQTEKTFSEYIGETTNNQAEYRALLKGLGLALENQVTDLECFLDSELVVQQVKREYKVKDQELGKLFVKVWNLTHKFSSLKFTHVERRFNKQADLLVNQALDKKAAG